MGVPSLPANVRCSIAGRVKLCQQGTIEGGELPFVFAVCINQVEIAGFVKGVDGHQYLVPVQPDNIAHSLSADHRRIVGFASESDAIDRFRSSNLNRDIGVFPVGVDVQIGRVAGDDRHIDLEFPRHVMLDSGGAALRGSALLGDDPEMLMALLGGVYRVADEDDPFPVRRPGGRGGVGGMAPILDDIARFPVEVDGAQGGKPAVRIGITGGGKEDLAAVGRPDRTGAIAVVGIIPGQVARISSGCRHNKQVGGGGNAGSLCHRDDRSCW